MSSNHQPSTSSDRLFIVHNTPQVQTGVERTIDEVQPVIEVPQVVDNILVDQVVQVDQELHDTSEQLDLLECCQQLMELQRLFVLHLIVL